MWERGRRFDRLPAILPGERTQSINHCISSNQPVPCTQHTIDFLPLQWRAAVKLYTLLFTQYLRKCNRQYDDVKKREIK